MNITNGGQVTAPSVLVGLLADGGGGNIDRIAVSGRGRACRPAERWWWVISVRYSHVSGGANVSDSRGIIGYTSATPGSLVLNGVGALDSNHVGANSVGIVTVSGAGSSWNNAESLIVGDNISIESELQRYRRRHRNRHADGRQGGAVTVNGGAGTINVAVNGGATGTINIGAAKGKAAAAPGTISAAEILFGSGTGGVVFNHTSANYGFGASIQGAGTVDVESGTTVLTANSSYTGATTVNGGTLSGGRLDRNLERDGECGRHAGRHRHCRQHRDQWRHAGAGQRSGSAFGPLTVQGNLSFTAASTYMIQVSPTGRTNVTGTATPRRRDRRARIL